MKYSIFKNTIILIFLASILALFMVAPIQPIESKQVEIEVNSVLPSIDSTFITEPKIETNIDTT